MTPLHRIRIRIFALRGKPVKITSDWWANRLRKTADFRAGLFDENTNGYRIIHGENDGWPGLVLDRYANVLVLKIYTAAWLARMDELTSLLRVQWPQHTIVLRLSRNIMGRCAP